MRLSTLTFAFVAACVFGAALVGPARAQGDFAPVLTVNGLAITGYELDQRIRFLTLLGASGDLPALAETALVEDRLRKFAARSAGLAVGEAELRGGLEEFAGRANLSVDQFEAALDQGGVDPETFRDFVEAGLLWREVVRQKYRGNVTATGSDVDRALSVTTLRGAGPRVLLSEIIIPARGGDEFVAQKAAIDLSKALSEGASFAEAARARSAAPSREAGGQVGWMPLTNLPGGAREAVAALSVGQVSEPVQVPGGFALFQLRGVDQGGPEVPAGSVTLDYLTLAVASTADATRAASSVATCDDLYSYARANRGTRLAHAEARAGAVPGDIAQALAPLDEYETAIISQGGAPALLMLCARTAVLAEGFDRAAAKAAAEASLTVPWADDGPPRIDVGLGYGQGPSRDAVSNELANQRLLGQAEQFMAQLKANATIVRTP